jgi:hypothetical protein
MIEPAEVSAGAQSRPRPANSAEWARAKSAKLVGVTPKVW